MCVCHHYWAYTHDLTTMTTILREESFIKITIYVLWKWHKFYFYLLEFFFIPPSLGPHTHKNSTFSEARTFCWIFVGVSFHSNFFHFINFYCHFLWDAFSIANFSPPLSAMKIDDLVQFNAHCWVNKRRKIEWR